MTPNPSQLSPSAVRIPGPELRSAEIFDNATGDGQEVRCVIPSEDPLLATDPLPWAPYYTPAGFYFPKRGDRAVIGSPPDGPPVILAWWPSASEPDIPA